MPRPRKNMVLCRRLVAAASARAHSSRTSSTAEAEVNQESESDADIQILGDDFSECEIRVASIEPLLVWKEGDDSSLRFAYIGDSRRTFFRKENQTKRCLNSVKDDPKIWNFYPKEVDSNKTDPIPAISPIAVAMEKLNADINVTPNVIVEKQNRNTTK
jgi:hypothetical protein